LSGMASIIAMRRARVAIQAGRDVVTKSVSVRKTLKGIGLCT
jgi:hypothetical protein